jgi:eukaryotic-like serine/threonine-protein kinase
MAGDLFAERYRLLEPLGRGAMSAVWLAEDEELGRRVAVKTLAPAADRARFEREARAVAALSHPNICALYDYGEAQGKPFMVLEYLPGGSLADLLEQGRPLADEETARIVAGVAEGLAHAHGRGLVHRDLKPANILFDAERRPKIADFGIAQVQGSGTLTESGTVLGTALYISPEQAAGQAATPASDIYSLGVILFQLLTGRLPFESPNAMEIVRQHRDEPPPSVHDLRPDAPLWLADLTARALAKDPASRPSDGAAFAAALAAEAEDATQVLQTLPGRRPRLRRGLLLAAAVLLLAGGIATAVVATHDSSSPSQTTPVNPTVPSVTAAPTAPSTTAPPTTTASRPTTTARTTTAPTTTARTTTAPTTTARPTTVPTTLPTTTAPLTTTAPTTTAPVTTAPTTTVDTTTTIPVTT